MPEPTRPLRVLFVTSEAAPFAKTGGLADVSGALPRALRARGMDVRVVMPLYAGIDWNALDRLEGSFAVPSWWGPARAGVRLGQLPRSDVPVYFLEYHRYFDRPYLYGPPGEGYADNLERFAFLSRGALELCKVIGFTPDVVNANDWQAALVPVYVNTVEWGKPLHGAGTVFSIHNMAYQGVTDGGALFITGLGREHYHPGEFEHFGALNLMKGAIRHANALTTVSPTYAREIQTPMYGCGLDGPLRERAADLVGILNGIDLDEWNPSADEHLAAGFTPRSLRGKAACKAALQREAGFAVDPKRPLFAAIGRMVPQKGLDVLAAGLDRILDWGAQVVLLASGDRDGERFFASVAARRPDRFKAWAAFDEPRAHRIEAGADFFVMPSRFEPCGLNQMYSQRYGTIPIVRATGGLVDTVEQYDERTGAGTGFLFQDLTRDALVNTVGWAVSTWYDRPKHVAAMRKRGMTRDFSWDGAAAEYEKVYRRAYRARRGHEFGG